MVFNIIALTIIIEAITAFFRFGLKKQSTRDTVWLAKYTFGYRIHHGYWGVLLVPLAYLLPLPALWQEIGVVVGWALILSDLAHHFLVLWPITGHHDFDIRYK